MRKKLYIQRVQLNGNYAWPTKKRQWWLKIDGYEIGKSKANKIKSIFDYLKLYGYRLDEVEVIVLKGIVREEDVRL